MTDKARRRDGIQELREIDLFEISITPAPANSDTRILNTKSVAEQAGPPPEFSPEQAAVHIQARDEMLTLLDC